MAKQYKVNSEFVSIDEQKGTLYNTGSTDAEVVSETNPTKGEGLVLRSGLTVPFASGVLVRSMDDDDPAIINVVDFKVSGEGGAAENTTATGVKTYARGTAYTKNDLVAYGSNLYLVVKDYTADTVENDLTAGNIVQVDAATATKLATARTIALSGDATGSATFDGSGDATIAAEVSKIGGTTISDFIKTLLDDGDAATARATLGAPSTTGANASGNWNINAATATKLATARTIALSGDATGSASFDGSGNATIATTLARTVGLTDLCPDGAAAHNCFYRGKDLTAAFNAGTVSANIANGTFRDIFVGDYIDKELTVNGTSIGTVRWRVGECDYYYRSGHSPCNTHHVLMVPDDVLNVQTRMNASNDTTGGYCASEMCTTTLPLYVTAIQNAFGTDHVLAHNELLTTAISADAPPAAGAGWTGSASGWGWKTVTANLFNEVMVYGTTAFSSSGFDVGNSKKQVALFALNHESTIAGYRGNHSDRKWYWLRAVASASRFCLADDGGDALSADASYRDGRGGVRPYFLLR